MAVKVEITENGEVEWVSADAFERVIRDREDYEEVLKEIASCEKRTDGDTVDLAQKVLAKIEERRNHDRLFR